MGYGALGIEHWALVWGKTVPGSEFRVGNLTSLLSTQHSLLRTIEGHWLLIFLPPALQASLS